MNHKEIRALLRLSNLCGSTSSTTTVCIQARGHDDGQHEQRWTVRMIVEPAGPSRYAPVDERDSTTYARISNGTMSYRGDNQEQGEWLADALNERDGI